MYSSDWHIHSEMSYDGSLKAEELLRKASMFGLKNVAITDHANDNSASFRQDILQSKKLYEKHKAEGFYLGVELTPISKYFYDFCKINPSGKGFVHPGTSKPDEIALALTMEELIKLGINYAVGAAHWVLNVPFEQDKVIKEWHRQQMYLATDKRIDILGHPWRFWGEGYMWCENDRYLGKPWFEDFTVIPNAMHDELAAALIENNVRIEANSTMIFGTRYSEKFYHQYNEYLRYMFEKGVGVTFGSDCHGPEYKDLRADVYGALVKAGFKKGDFSSPVIHNR